MSIYYKRTQNDYELVAGAMNKSSTSIYDDELSSVSENAVQNKVVTAALNQNRELSLSIRSAKQDKELSEDIEYGDSTYHTVEDTLNALANQSVTQDTFNTTVTSLEESIDTKQDIIQVNALPSEGEENRIYQYVGDTAGSVIHGLFYEYVDDGWEVVSTSPAPVKTTDVETDSFIYVNKDGYIPLDFNPDSIPTTWTLVDGTTNSYTPDSDIYYVYDGSYHKIEQAELYNGTWTVLANGWNDWPEDGIYTPKTVITVTTDEDKYEVDTSETIDALYQKKELSEAIGEYTTVESALAGLASDLSNIDTDLHVYEVDQSTISTIRPTENAFILKTTNNMTSGAFGIEDGSYVLTKCTQGSNTYYRGVVSVYPNPGSFYPGGAKSLGEITLYSSGSFIVQPIDWLQGNTFWLDDDFKGIATMLQQGEYSNVYYRGRWAAGDTNSEYGSGSDDGWYILGTGDDSNGTPTGLAFSSTGTFSISIHSDIFNQDLDDTDWTEWANNETNVKITKLASDSELQELKAKVDQLESEVPVEYTVNGTNATNRYYKVTVSHMVSESSGFLSGILHIQDRKGSQFNIPIANGYYRNDTAYWLPGYERNSMTGTERINGVAWVGYEASYKTSFIVKTGQWDNDNISFSNSYNNYNSTTGTLQTHIEVEESTESDYNDASLVYFRDITRPNQQSFTVAASASNWQVFKFSQGAITNGMLPLLVGTYSGGYYNTFIVNRFDSYTFNDQLNWMSNIVVSDASISDTYIAFKNTAGVTTTYTFTPLGNFQMEISYVGALDETTMKSTLGITTIENSLGTIVRRISFDTLGTTGTTLTTTRNLFGQEGVLEVCGWDSSGNSFRNRYYLSYNPRNGAPVIKLMQYGLGETTTNPVTSISATKSGSEVTLSITPTAGYSIGTAVRFIAS